jgi:hypothetical protein
LIENAPDQTIHLNAGSGDCRHFCWTSCD